MDKKTTHIDVGLSRGIAHTLGTQPTILVLCGATDCNTIRDSQIDIRVSGGFPAACDCGACKAIADIMYREDKLPQQARRIYYRRRKETITT